MSLPSKRLILISALMSASSMLFTLELQAANTIDTNKTQSTITSSSQSHLEWGISEVEYSRYQELMKGMRGSISPDTISPIEVLGIHARNDAERKKYARMWADEMEKDTQRVLAFNKAYNDAWVAKGSPALVDISKLDLGNAEPFQNKASTPLNGNGNDLLLVTMLANCEPCDDRLEKALTVMQVDRQATLDIYFIDSENAAKGVIRQWAAQKRIEVALLKDKRITLNHGQNIAEKLNLSNDELPAVFKKNEKGGVKRVE